MRRALILRTLAILLGLVILELGVRLVSLPFGGPRVLVYGTPWYRQRIEVPPGFEHNVAYHQSEAQGYTKYFPHEEKFVRDTRGLHRVRINNLGLRGPDVATTKAPGVQRVLTLGASSTFGFENRDDETYPFYLQRVLDRRAGPGRFEVVNFSVPHANSDQILAMFLIEGLPLAPDVVTIYEGINDSKEASLESGTSMLGVLARWSLAALQLQQVVTLVVGPSANAAWGDSVIRRASAEYLGNLTILDERCLAAGIRLIVVTQQAKSLLVEPPHLRGLTYATEVALVARHLAGEAPTPGDPPLVDGLVQRFTAPALVTHAGVMDALRVWAAEHDRPVVEGIAAVDARRDLLVTWVHLAPLANKMLARAIAQEIVPQASGLRRR
jgi:hypothetical protein